MSDVKDIQENTTTATGGVPPIDNPTKEVDTKDAKTEKGKAASVKPKPKTKPTNTKAQPKAGTTEKKETKPGDELEQKNAQKESAVSDEPKSLTEKRTRLAKQKFEEYPGLDTIYFTSDLLPFAKENDAVKHAQGLNNKIVTPVIKED